MVWSSLGASLERWFEHDVLRLKLVGICISRGIKTVSSGLHPLRCGLEFEFLDISLETTAKRFSASDSCSGKAGGFLFKRFSTAAERISRRFSTSFSSPTSREDING